MSAYVVDQVHIDLLVAVGLRGPSGRAVNPGNAWRSPISWFTCPRAEVENVPWSALSEYRRELDYTTADAVGGMLWSENMASVAYRYNDAEDMPGPIGLTIADGLTYRWTNPGYQMTAVEALKALAGYEYQTCEHPGWPTSEAQNFCDSLRHSLINALPGIEQAPWTWTTTDLAAAKAGRRLHP